MRTFRRISAIVLFVLWWQTASVNAQQVTTETADELKALVFALQTKLAAVEKELGQEKARRAELELAELQRARETLDPGVKKKLGLPVPDAKVAPAEKTPPKN